MNVQLNLMTVNKIKIALTQMDLSTVFVTMDIDLMKMAHLVMVCH